MLFGPIHCITLNCLGKYKIEPTCVSEVDKGRVHVIHQMTHHYAQSQFGCSVTYN